MSKPESPPAARHRWPLRFIWRASIALGLLLLVFVIGFSAYALIINARGDAAVSQIEQELANRDLLDLYPNYDTGQLYEHYSKGTNAAYWRAAMEAQPDAGDLPLLYAGTVASVDIQPCQQYHSDTVAALKKIYRDNPEFLTLVDKAKNAPPGRFDLMPSMSDPYGGMEPLGGARSVARWLVERAKLAETENDGQAFTDAIVTVLQISGLLNEEPWIMPALVAGSIDAMARDAMIDGLSRITLTTNQLDQLIAAFQARRDAMQITGPIGYELSWEFHAIGEDVQSSIRASESRMALLTREINIQSPELDLAENLPSTASRLWHGLLLGTCPGRYELRFAKKLNAQLLAYDELEKYKDNPERRWIYLKEAYEKQREAEEKAEEQAKDLVFWQFRQMDGSNVVITARTLVRMDCVLAITLATLKVERYRVEHARWPDTLQQAMGRVPTDGRGQAIRYRPTPDGVMIYSTGNNLIDEQGYGHLENEVPDKYLDPDDEALRLYRPDKRNSIPPPPHATEQDVYDDSETPDTE